MKEDMRRMLQEVRLFAAISNPHIIRYNHSWIEVVECPTDSTVEHVTQPADVPNVELESPFIEFAGSSNGSSADDNSSKDGENSRRDSELERNSKKLMKVSLFIQMELCAETLEDYLNRQAGTWNPTEYRERLNIAGQLIDAIYAIHCDYKIIHRDLSLRNIFIAKDGAIKIGDFGLATKCRHFIPVLASPFAIKPMEPQPEETPDSFVLSDTSEKAESGSEQEAAEDVDSDELTHGVGTKTFAAPEQMSDLPYDQKADIYSLGLILLVLFNPTQTLSERHEIIKKCRQQGPSKEFMTKYPELGAMIKNMTSDNPAIRPTAENLKDSPVFRQEDKTAAEWENIGLNGEKCLVKIGVNGKCKTKYVKIYGGNLLLYAKKTDQKARLCYPLAECKIMGSSNLAPQQAPLRRNRSFNYSIEDVLPVGYSYKASIEHPDLETLHFFVQNSTACSTS